MSWHPAKRDTYSFRTCRDRDLFIVLFLRADHGQEDPSRFLFRSATDAFRSRYWQFDVAPGMARIIELMRRIDVEILTVGNSRRLTISFVNFLIQRFLIFYLIIYKNELLKFYDIKEYIIYFFIDLI